MMKTTTCCFTGHRILPAAAMEGIIKRLDEEIDRLCRQGVKTFLSGGALGFDQVAAALVIAKREQGFDVRLEFALPCREPEKFWTAAQRTHFYQLLRKADEIHYVSEQYSASCMKKRNEYLVNRSAICICALLYTASGTGQTVRYAQSRGLAVINVAAESQQAEHNV